MDLWSREKSHVQKGVWAQCSTRETISMDRTCPLPAPPSWPTLQMATDRRKRTLERAEIFILPAVTTWKTSTAFEQPWFSIEKSPTNGGFSRAMSCLPEPNMTETHGLFRCLSETSRSLRFAPCTARCISCSAKPWKAWWRRIVTWWPALSWRLGSQHWKPETFWGLGGWKIESYIEVFRDLGQTDFQFSFVSIFQPWSWTMVIHCW